MCVYLYIYVLQVIPIDVCMYVYIYTHMYLYIYIYVYTYMSINCIRIPIFQVFVTPYGVYCAIFISRVNRKGLLDVLITAYTILIKRYQIELKP